jgi:hypothetical protein
LILLRARTWGETDWDEVAFEGEREAEFFALLGEALVARDLHVQFRVGEQPWENL